MKHIFVLAIAAVVFTSCQQNKSTTTETVSTDSTVTTTATTEGSVIPVAADAPVLTFEKTVYDFNTIKQGEKVHYDFKFKNTGKTPLIVSNATASCGCTVPESPKEPVAPGETGVIKVVFDSTGKTGKQDKVITVSSNANPAVNEVHLIGDVIAP